MLSNIVFFEMKSKLPFKVYSQFSKETAQRVLNNCPLPNVLNLYVATATKSNILDQTNSNYSLTFTVAMLCGVDYQPRLLEKTY